MLDYQEYVLNQIDRSKHKTIIQFHDYAFTDDKKLVPPGRIGKLHGNRRKSLLYRLFNTNEVIDPTEINVSSLKKDYETLDKLRDSIITTVFESTIWLGKPICYLRNLKGVPNIAKIIKKSNKTLVTDANDLTKDDVIIVHWNMKVNKLEFVRIGIRHDSLAFYRAIVALTNSEYFKVVDTEKDKIVQTFKNDMINDLNNRQLFLSLNKGQINKQYKNGKAFANAIRSNKGIGHRELVDLIHKMFQINLFIFEVDIPEKGDVRDINILCQFSEQLFNENNHSVFLINRGNTYEPIMQINWTDKKIQQTMFKYNTQNENSKNIANIIYDLYRTLCIPSPIHMPTGFTRPLTANETARRIDDHDRIIGQIIQGNRCEGLLIQLNNKETITIPVVPSDPLYSIQKPIPILKGTLLLNPAQLKSRLEKLVNITAGKLQISPKSQVINNNGKTVALLLENTMLAPTKPSLPLKSLTISSNIKYYGDIDEFIHTRITLNDSRTEQARKRKRHTDFWYHLLIQLALYFRTHNKVKTTVINIVDSGDNNIIKKRNIHDILANIMIRIFNNRRLKPLFPVDILGIRGNEYFIDSKTKKYKPCKTIKTDIECGQLRHCEYNTNNKCVETPEQKILNKYYFTILHEITTDSAHQLVNGELGHMLELIEKVDSIDEEQMIVTD